jgi:DNA mismatch repair protein MutS2
MGHRQLQTTLQYTHLDEREQHEAARQKEEYQKKAEEVELESRKAAALREFRSRLQANDRVKLTRFDQPGRIVRLDSRKNIAVVSVGLGQWEVPMDEVFPLE